jgi:hypothetical protein
LVFINGRAAGAGGVGRQSQMIGDGMPKMDLLSDDLQIAPVVARALSLEKSRREQAELKVKSARLRLLRELTSSLASNKDLNDALREVTDRTRRLMRSDFALLGLLDRESSRLANVFAQQRQLLSRERVRNIVRRGRLSRCILSSQL